MCEFTETDDGQLSFLEDPSIDDFPSEIPEDVESGDIIDEEQLDGQESFPEDDIPENNDEEEEEHKDFPQKFMEGISEWHNEHPIQSASATFAMDGMNATTGHADQLAAAKEFSQPQAAIVCDVSESQQADMYTYEQSENQEKYELEAEALGNAENEPTVSNSDGNNNWKPDVPGVTFDPDIQYTYKPK